MNTATDTKRQQPPAVASIELFCQFQEVMGWDDEGICGLFIKGHEVDAEQMKAQAVAYMKHHYDEDVTVHEISRERWRTVPRGDYGSEYVKGEGRGSFPVTQLSFREWLR